MDSDQLSRLGMRLDTSTGPYDEVVAFTERIINKNFATLFELYPEMKYVTFDDPDVGYVDVELDPSQVIIPGGEEDDALSKEILYQIRFKSGIIRSAMGSLNEDVSGWELAIPTRLNSETSESKPAGVDKNGNERHETEIGGQIFNHPGDYSVQRLFAQLSKATFNNPDTTYSTVLDSEKKRITLEEWKTRKDKKGLFTILMNVLAEWANEQQQAGRSTLNVTFNLPKERYNINEPTYAPTYVYQQTYPYINPDKGVSKAETRLKGDGMNCLIWCEMVAANPPPMTKQLPWSGNLVTQESASKADDAIDGTFVVGHHIFLKKHLLPRLQPFCQASTIANLTSEPYQRDDTHGLEWDYSTGAFQVPSNDKMFEFKRFLKDPNDGNSLARYEYNYTETDPGSGRIHVYPDGYANKLRHDTQTKVEVSWTEGKNVLKIEGTSTYTYESQYFRDRTLNEQTALLKYCYHLSWNISILLEDIENGQVKFHVDSTGKNGLPQGNVRVWQDPTTLQNVSTPDNQEKNIASAFQESLNRILLTLPDTLNTQLSSTAKFIYPGNGDLDFCNPVFSRAGNVLAEIQYKPIAMEDVIHVEAPLIIKKAPVIDVQLRKTTVSAGGYQLNPKLTWKVNPEPIPASQTSRVTLTGINETDGPIGYGYFRIRFTSGSEGPNLFAADKINEITGPLWKGSSAGGNLDSTTIAEHGKPASSPGSEHKDSKKDVAQSEKSENKNSSQHQNMGTVTVSCTAAGVELGPVEVNQNETTSAGEYYWQAVIRPVQKTSGFCLGKGESVTLTFDLETGVARTYPIIVGESWRDPKNPTKLLKGIPAQSDEISVNAVVKKL